MNSDIERVLYSEEFLHDTVKRLGEQITEDYKGKKLLLLGILKGSVVFLTDLMRCIDLPCEIDFMAVSTYGNGVKSSGTVRIIKDLDRDIRDCDVLIVEDILDSGMTLSYLMELLYARDPGSIKICTLFDKPDRRKVDVFADYSGLCVPDEFIVGYGLDYAEKYRNLPYVGILKREIYETKE
ncbi:MAG: hypoxanthine phosphoribosyltransferase [Oscillospiraceae bacterium]|nr:hypoxanthine phosphoribosyltransferase [Oscillospiraceae bacterium]